MLASCFFASVLRYITVFNMHVHCMCFYRNTSFVSAIGNAYAVLSDADKRKKYDLYGPELQQTSQYTSDYTHGGFEGISAPCAVTRFVCF